MRTSPELKNIDGYDCRRCTKCDEWKPLSEFYTARNGAFGVKANCKSCELEAGKRRREADVDAARAYANAHYLKHRDRYRQVANDNYWKDPEKAKAASRLWRAENPDAIREINARQEQKRLSTVRGRLQVRMRAGMRRGLAEGSKAARRTFDLLGYTVDELRAHLESLFLDGMTWENYGKWHIDHIVPLSAHNYETPDDIDFKRAWALSNLQPLWAIENIKKGAKLANSFQPSLALAA